MCTAGSELIIRGAASSQGAFCESMDTIRIHWTNSPHATATPKPDLSSKLLEHLGQMRN